MKELRSNEEFKKNEDRTKCKRNRELRKDGKYKEQKLKEGKKGKWN